jgi:hypothetical protein
MARAIFVLLGPGEAALQVIAAIYALFVLAAILLGSATIRRLVPWQSPSTTIAGLLFVVSPMPLWLVGKTLPESPALLATSVALYAFVRALACPDPRRATPWLALTSLALVAIALTRNVFILAPLTLGASLLLFGGWRFPPGRVLAHGVAVGAVSGAFLIGTLALLGIELSSYFWVVGFARQEHAPSLFVSTPCSWKVVHFFLRYRSPCSICNERRSGSCSSGSLSPRERCLRSWTISRRAIFSATWSPSSGSAVSRSKYSPSGGEPERITSSIWVPACSW